MSSFPSPFLGCFFSLGHSALATHLHHRVSCFTPSARQHRVSLFPGARKGKTKTSASAVLPFRAPGNPGRKGKTALALVLESCLFARQETQGGCAAEQTGMNTGEGELADSVRMYLA